MNRRSSSSPRWRLRSAMGTASSPTPSKGRTKTRDHPHPQAVLARQPCRALTTRKRHRRPVGRNRRIGSTGLRRPSGHPPNRPMPRSPNHSTAGTAGSPSMLRGVLRCREPLRRISVFIAPSVSSWPIQLRSASGCTPSCSASRRITGFGSKSRYSLIARRNSSSRYSRGRARKPLFKAHQAMIESLRA